MIYITLEWIGTVLFVISLVMVIRRVLIPRNSCTRIIKPEIILFITSMVLVTWGILSCSDSCASMVKPGIILFITSTVMAFGAGYLTAEEILDELQIRARRRVLLSSAFDLFLPLLSYMFAQIEKNESIPNSSIHLYLRWMILVEIIRQQFDTSCTGKLILATTFSAKSLGSMYRLARIGWLGYLVYRYTLLPDLRIKLIVPCVLSAAYEVVNCVVFKKAKGSLLIGKNPELIGRHVKRVMIQGNLKTIPLDRCDYVVLGEDTQMTDHQSANMKGFLTIGWVFRPESAEEDQAFTSTWPHWRDNCLSFALSKMLRRRFVGLPLAEAGSSKALDFVLKGLIDHIGGGNEHLAGGQQGENIPQEENDPIARVFDILSDELNLVSAFLHSKVLVRLSTGWVDFLEFSFHLIFLCLMLMVLSMKFTFVGTEDKDRQCIFNLNFVMVDFDNFIKVFLSMAWFSLLKLKETFRYSKRLGTLKDVRTYFKNPKKWKQTELSFYHDPYQDQRNQLEFKETEWQYSVLDIKVRSISFERLPKLIRRQIRRVDRTEITIDVKEAVLRSFTDSNGKLTSGESALSRHGMNARLNWACMPNGSTTEAILVWHIATTIFGRLSASSWFSGPAPKEQKVASTLSAYCHYLVASHPELLPDDVKMTERMYEDLREEILSFYCSSEVPISARCNRVLQATWSENSIVWKGVKLAKELMELAADQVEGEICLWRMLAEFWAEMMLFVAPSENVEGHEKVLHAKEFITQIWALLTHAGIVTRPKLYEIVPDMV